MVDIPYSAAVEVEQAQSQKEVTINEGLTRISAMMAATLIFSGITGDVVPTFANPAPEWQTAIKFILQGTPGASFDFECPSGADFCKFFIVQNDTDSDVDVQVGSGPAGTVVTVASSTSAILYSDGTDITQEGGGSGGTEIIPLDLGSTRIIVSDDIDTLANHGGILTNDSTPSYARVSGATDRALRISWLVSDVDEVQFPPVPMPPDLNSGQDLTIHLLARMAAGSMDTPNFDVRVFDAIGDTEMGGTTANLSTTLAELTRTIVAADISGHPLGFLNITLTPGAHNTAANTVELYAAWIEYTKKQA